MNIKSYLENYPYINTELLRIQRELNEAIQGKKDTYCTLKAVPITGMPGSPHISDSVYASVQTLVDRYDVKILRYTHEINSILDEKALFEKIWFSNAIMSNEDRAIIELRCFERYRWPDISRKMKYSEKQCQRLFERVLKKMQCEVDKLCQIES